MSVMDNLPLWLLAVIMVGSLSAVIELGFRAGKRIASEEGLSKHPIEASISTAMLGLLAFMLAFTFGAAVSRYKEGRSLAISDTNLASSLYRLADLMEEPDNRDRFRNLVREYLDIRTEAIATEDHAKLSQALDRSRSIQEELWDLIRTEDPPPNTLVSTWIKFVENDTTRRANGLYNRLPITTWFVLGGLAILTTGLLGMNSGLHGRRSRLVATIFIIAYSLVLLLIVDIDRPFRSLFSTSDQIAEEALRNMSDS